MCGRFTSTVPPEELMRKFGVKFCKICGRWNVAPTQQAMVIVRHGLQNEALWRNDCWICQTQSSD